MDEVEVKGFVRAVDEIQAKKSKPTDKIFRGSDGAMYSALEMQALMSEVWSNNACMGYVIMALEELKYSEDEIKRIVAAVRNGFEWTTLQEADTHYCRSEY